MYAFAGVETTVVGMGLLRALAPVIWFSTFSALTIVVKWLALGRGVRGQIPLNSVTYLTWWYVSTTLNVWEAVGGWWLLDTKLLILFYRLMGARVRLARKYCVFLSYPRAETGYYRPSS